MKSTSIRCDGFLYFRSEGGGKMRIGYMLLLGGPCTTLASRHVASATPAVTSSASGVAAASQQPLE